jgi:two-component system response regulator CpxR
MIKDPMLLDPKRRPSMSTDQANPELSILLIDDDVELADLMREFFERRSIRLETAHDGRRGLSKALAGDADLILLDVMMPGLDGFELLRLLRRQSEVPVIMLTARTAQVDRVAGLDAGADDYLPKPFGPEELLARVRAVLRRSRRSADPSVEPIRVGPITCFPASREVRCEGKSVGLTTIEYDLFEHLARAAGRIVSRDELTSALYRRPASPFDRALDVHVSHIRKKLGSQGGSIRTIRGTGFLFQVSEAADSSFSS